MRCARRRLVVIAARTQWVRGCRIWACKCQGMAWGAWVRCRRASRRSDMMSICGGSTEKYG
eukprot:390156-Pelagomonas_calceolata.AAC.1